MRIYEGAGEGGLRGGDLVARADVVRVDRRRHEARADGRGGVVHRRRGRGVLVDRVLPLLVWRGRRGGGPEGRVGLVVRHDAVGAERVPSGDGVALVDAVLDEGRVDVGVRVVEVVREVRARAGDVPVGGGVLVDGAARDQAVGRVAGVGHPGGHVHRVRLFFGVFHEVGGARAAVRRRGGGAVGVGP